MDETMVDKRVKQVPLLGQTLLQKNFSLITHEEMYEKLGCKEIQDLEQAKARGEFLQRILKGHSELTASDVKIQRWAYNKLEAIWGNGIWGKKEKVSDDVLTWCKVSTKPLEHFMNQQIPNNCLLKVEEAKEIGLTEFRIAYPNLRPAGDPIIYAVMRDGDNEQYIFITQW